MINFRYHLISLVAVFLALGIGIVMGSTVIDRAIVESLRSRIDNAEKNSIERKIDNDRLRNAIEQQALQDTVLAAHSVRGYLNDQTVYIVTMGNVSDDVRVEAQELLAVSGARLGSVIDFNEDFLKGPKTQLARELLALENVTGSIAGELSRDRQLSLILSETLAQRAGTVSELPLPTDQIFNSFESFNAFTEKEKSASFDPVQNVSFLLLANRSELQDERTSQFVVNFHSKYPTTVGFVGSETDTPNRSNAIGLFETKFEFFSIVDNAEAPGGRAAMLIAHAGTINGSREIYGVSDRANSPAPELVAP